MTDLPAEALDLATKAVGASIGRMEPSQVIARRALEAAAPAIREQAATAERERIRRFAAAMRSDSTGDSDVLALIREFETAAAAAERQLCVQLAEQHRAHYGCYVSVGDTVTSGLRSFADLLRDQPQPAGADAQPGTTPADNDGARGSDTQPDPYIDTLAAQHVQEFEPGNQDGDHG